jgi:hypothetical protein
VTRRAKQTVASEIVSFGLATSFPWDIAHCIKQQNIIRTNGDGLQPDRFGATKLASPV